MATIVIALLLCILVYELCIFIMYPSGVSHTRKSVEAETEVAKVTASDDDIMGKSHFDMKKECRLMRQRKEEADRKAAIAKGEMTEDGKEIAQEVQAEDCEVEQKKVWQQVPAEELEAMFEEPDEPNEPLARGDTIDDIDLAFNNVGRRDMSEEEERRTVEVLKGLEGTELFDTITQSFPQIGDSINDLFDKYEHKPSAETVTAEGNKTTEPKKPFVIPERFEDFNIRDFV